MRTRILVVLVALATVSVASGCGGDSDRSDLVVSAASSLKVAFSQYGEGFDAAEVRTSFAASDELAAQIEKGLKPDLYAAANTDLLNALHAKSLVERPVVFARNRLVIAVPAGSNNVGSIGDLGKKGVTIAMGSPTVPAGRYARKVISGLREELRIAIERNVRSNEPDVKGVVGKLVNGAVDAGFVYITDVKASEGKLRQIEFPARLQPSVAYAIAVVRGAKHPDLARSFIQGLIDGPGRAALAEAGYEPIPQPVTPATAATPATPATPAAPVTK